jgi:hypothetical protein
MELCTNTDGNISVPNGELWHVANLDNRCPSETFYNGPMVARVVVPKKYTVIMNDGIGPSSNEPVKPVTSNQASSIDDAKRMFREWMRKSGNDYTRADGYSQPGAEVILTENWDGISYGDHPWTCLLVRGPNGGVVIENV